MARGHRQVEQRSARASPAVPYPADCMRRSILERLACLTSARPNPESFFGLGGMETSVGEENPVLCNVATHDVIGA